MNISRIFGVTTLIEVSSWEDLARLRAHHTEAEFIQLMWHQRYPVPSPPSKGEYPIKTKLAKFERREGWAGRPDPQLAYILEADRPKPVNAKVMQIKAAR